MGLDLGISLIKENSQTGRADFEPSYQCMFSMLRRSHSLKSTDNWWTSSRRVRSPSRKQRGFVRKSSGQALCYGRDDADYQSQANSGRPEGVSLPTIPAARRLRSLTEVVDQLRHVERRGGISLQTNQQGTLLFHDIAAARLNGVPYKSRSCKWRVRWSQIPNTSFHAK